MKSAIITLLAICLFSLPMFAQINADDVSDQFEAPETEVVPVDTDDKKQREHEIYYRYKGGMTLNINNYIVSKTGIVSMPVSLNLDYTVSPNFTLGPVFNYFQLKNTDKVSETQVQIKDGNINYHQFTMGLKANWHLMPLFQHLSKKPMLTDYVDVYVSAWAGYSMMFSGSDKANNQFMNRNEMIRGGVALGVRSMVLPRFGFFLEGGYSSVGYGSFGISVALK